MSIIVTTTGATPSITLNDLGGRVLTHSFSGDLESEFRRDLILGSADLQSAINNNFVTVTDPMGNLVPNLSNLLLFQSSLSAGQGATYSPSGVITVDAEAFEIPFTAATPSNWTATASGPLDVKDALDDIALRTQLVEDGGGINTDAQQISSTASVSTTSKVFVDMPNMVLTTNNLVDRKYLVLFNATFTGQAGAVATVDVLVDGIPLPASIRIMEAPSANSNFIVATTALTADLTTGLEVKVQWHSTVPGAAKTITVVDRSLIIYSIEGGAQL